MSDTPGSTPAPEAPKPRLSLTPKAPAPAPAPAAELPAATEPGAVPPPPPPAPAPQTSSAATPDTLLAANKLGAPRPSLKLSGTPHPAIENPTDAKFETPAADTSSDAPPLAVVALAALAAVAALAFAALLYLKNQ